MILSPQSLSSGMMTSKALYIKLRISNNEPPSISQQMFKWSGDRVPFQKYSDEESVVFNYNPNTHAIVQWQDAKDYCQWLGKKLDLPIDLPTEAQWEYAALSGAYEVLFANQMADFDSKPVITDSRYSLSSEELELIKKNNLKIIEKHKVIDPKHLIALSPAGTLLTPNHLGFYDMDTNGEEWVNDWWGDTYFKDNPIITNPQGATTGKYKVVKVVDIFVFDRHPFYPLKFASFRCAVNQQTPVNLKCNWVHFSSKDTDYSIDASYFRCYRDIGLFFW